MQLDPARPEGQVGIEQKNLILIATGLMLLVVIPVIIMTLAFAWKYRASNKAATYTPDWSHSTKIEAAVWIIPILIIIALGYVTYHSTHKLDPYRPLDSDVKPVQIDVVALDWKWLFIYPEQGIATVNKIVFPANTPVNFRVTSDAVMNSFFIPGLGGQIYAMAGMTTKLHLIANENDEFDGISANYSGAGFTGMKFKLLPPPRKTSTSGSPRSSSRRRSWTRPNTTPWPNQAKTTQSRCTARLRLSSSS